MAKKDKTGTQIVRFTRGDQIMIQVGGASITEREALQYGILPAGEVSSSPTYSRREDRQRQNNGR